MASLSRRSIAIIGLVSAAILFVAINVIANRTLGTTRIDLTQNKLYTLSPGTRATLSKLDEPIVLRFYYSKKLGNEIPSYGVYAQRVRELLEEYSAAANGKIQLQELDPQPFSAVEDRAVAFGLQGVPLDQGGEQIYFGLAATNSTDDLQIIPFFQPEREPFLEYDLTKLIHSLAFPKKPVIGLITDLPLEGDMMAAMQGQPMIPYAVIDQIKPLYEIKDLSTEIDSVPSDVDVLMIAHPQHLSDKTLYAIDQYVLGGGKALVFVDPNSETQQMHRASSIRRVCRWTAICPSSSRLGACRWSPRWSRAIAAPRAASTPVRSNTSRRWITSPGSRSTRPTSTRPVRSPPTLPM